MPARHPSKLPTRLANLSAKFEMHLEHVPAGEKRKKEIIDVITVSDYSMFLHYAAK